MAGLPANCYTLLYFYFLPILENVVRKFENDQGKPMMLTVTRDQGQVQGQGLALQGLDLQAGVWSLSCISIILKLCLRSYISTVSELYCAYCASAYFIFTWLFGHFGHKVDD